MHSDDLRIERLEDVIARSDLLEFYSEPVAGETGRQIVVLSLVTDLEGARALRLKCDPEGQGVC